MADKNMEAQIYIQFDEATSRQSLDSGESVNTLFGKIKKWLSDLKTIAFSGSYNDLSDKPKIPNVDSELSETSENPVQNKIITSALNNKAESNHVHSYAGSSSEGGSATSAVKLDSSAGSTVNPVYFSEGKPVACTYTLGKSVPSNAVFTDTVYTLPKATISALGGVMPDGTTITVDEQGVISAVGSGDGLEFIGEYYVSSQTTIISKADYKEGDIYLILVRSDSSEDWKYCIYALLALPTSPVIKRLNCVPSIEASAFSVSIRLDSVGLSVSDQGYYKFYKMKVG